jgi:hypothetical protein
MEDVMQNENQNSKATPQGFALLVQRKAMKLECMGLQMSRTSLTAWAKKQFGFKGNKQAIYEQFSAYVTEQTGVPEEGGR